MKHSKLPWNLLSYPVAGQEEESCKIWTPDSAWSVASGLSLDNGLFIVTACNEHDTLKAKEVLFGETIIFLKVVNSLLGGDITKDMSSRLQREIGRTLAKAKEENNDIGEPICDPSCGAGSNVEITAFEYNALKAENKQLKIDNGYHIETIHIGTEGINALQAKIELYEEALEKIAKHGYKGIVVQTAYEALSKAKEL